MLFCTLTVDAPTGWNYTPDMEDLRDIKFDFQKLREARGQRPQAHVARAVGISKQQLWNYENGLHDPSTDVLLKLCLFYKKPIEFFSSVGPGEKIFANLYIGG